MRKAFVLPGVKRTTVFMLFPEFRVLDAAFASIFGDVVGPGAISFGFTERFHGQLMEIVDGALNNLGTFLCRREGRILLQCRDA